MMSYYIMTMSSEDAFYTGIMHYLLFVRARSFVRDVGRRSLKYEFVGWSCKAGVLYNVHVDAESSAVDAAVRNT